MADAGSISLNGFNCCVLIGAAAIGGACSSLCSASDEAAKFTGSSLGGWCQAAKAALIANVWFGLPVCRMGGLPGGNLWSPENCGLFCITGAVGSVIEGTWRVQRASRLDGLSTCCVATKESRECSTELDGVDEGRRLPAIGSELIFILPLYSVRYGSVYVCSLDTAAP